MSNSMKSFLSGIALVLFSIGSVQADCILTAKNFTKNSRVIYVNPTNGSDQLAQRYNYNLNNQRNPYEPRRIVAFQNLDQALSARNTGNADIVLVKTGASWTNYDAWSQNKTTEFNNKSSEIKNYSQRQCRGDNLTWVPSAVTDTQTVEATTVTEFTNQNEVTLAKADITPTTKSTYTRSYSTDAPQTFSTSEPKRRTGGSSGGGSKTDSTSLTSEPDNSLLQQVDETTNNSRTNNTKSTDTTLQDGVTNATTELSTDTTELSTDTNDEIFVQDEVEVIAKLDTNETTNVIDNESYSATCEVNAPWENTIQTHLQDSDGWSVIKPDSETRIIYVSSISGSDNYARPYLISEISDPFNPPSHINAYRTLEQAYAQMRNSKPDWILLKKGERFELQNTLWLKSGTSHSARVVISSYGDNNLPRPIIDSNVITAFRGNKIINYITIAGIEFYASGRDPASDSFVGWDKIASASGISYVAGGDSYGIHIENNRFSYYSGGIGMQALEGQIKNTVIRRNQVLNSYSTAGHSQGIYLSKLNGALIEENFLDHNGWYQQRPKDVALNTPSYGYATFFNHNIYTNTSSNLLIRKNISSRSSSIGMKFTSNSNGDLKVDTINSQNILLDGNLIVEGEVGFSLGGNKDFNTGYRWDNINVVNNVLTNIGRSKPTNRSLSFNIDANDWKTGSICNNIIADKDDKTLTNNYGINTQGYIGAVNISNNHVINLGLEEEGYSENAGVKSYNNRYIPLIKNVNYLDNYVKSKGFIDYATYLKFVRDKLKQSSSVYYNVDEAIDYIELQAKY